MEVGLAECRESAVDRQAMHGVVLRAEQGRGAVKRGVREREAKERRGKGEKG